MPGDISNGLEPQANEPAAGSGRLIFFRYNYRGETRVSVVMPAHFGVDVIELDFSVLLAPSGPMVTRSLKRIINGEKSLGRSEIQTV